MLTLWCDLVNDHTHSAYAVSGEVRVRILQPVLRPDLYWLNHGYISEYLLQCQMTDKEERHRRAMNMFIFSMIYRYNRKLCISEPSHGCH